jgi:hypothetical protein
MMRNAWFEGNRHYTVKSFKELKKMAGAPKPLQTKEIVSQD